MAHHVEPMDIDSDFDNKENSLHHNNVLPFTEKGYEELDVSELNMKLRYSITPASSPMSKSFTANCLDNRSLESADDSRNVTLSENSNLSRSLNATMTKSDNVIKSLKALPLQAISTEQFVDSNRNTSVLRPIDTTVSQDNANVTVTISGPSDVDDNLLSSSTSTAVQTPESTTPTKDNLKNDGGSPIMRGLKSVLNMFRSSQSPIPPPESEDIVKPEILSPADVTVTSEEVRAQSMLASTPISTHRKKETSPTKRNSPHKETIVFNEDLEKELQWKDETTIIFSQERIPIHKLFFLQPGSKDTCQAVPTQDVQDDMNSTVEYMDISYNDSLRDRTMTDIQVTGTKADSTFAGESDGEFVDCETTFTKNDSLLDDKDMTPVIENTQSLDLTKDVENTKENTSASRLKQIILNTTQDILDATLSITPEDLLPEVLHKTENISGQQPHPEITEQNIPCEIKFEQVDDSSTTVLGERQNSSQISQEDFSSLNQTRDVISPSMNVHHEEDSNVTKTNENTIPATFNEPVEITKSLTNTGHKEDLDVTNTIKNILTEPEIFENQLILQNTDTTVSSSETIVLNDKTFDDQLTNNDIDLIQETSQDLESNRDLKLNKTGLNTTHVSEHNSSNMVENLLAKISNPEALVDTSKPLPIHDDEVMSTPVKEASMTELAAEIPLPDEDDLEKEQNIPTDIATEVPAPPISLPLDLVDDIKVQPEMPELIHNVPVKEVIAEEKLETKENKDDKNALSQEQHFIERGTDKIQNETVSLDSEVPKADPEVIENIIVKNRDLPLIEEPEIVTVDVLPKTAQSLNIDVTSTENIVDQVHGDVEVMNRIETVTECLTATDTCKTDENIGQVQEIMSMDVNESVIGLKPLPDIINQTNIMPNVENLESVINISEPEIQEQPTILSDNVEIEANDIIEPEIVHKDVLELLANAHISEVVKPENEEINKAQVIDITTGNTVIPDTQLNYVGVIPQEPVTPEIETQVLGTGDALGSESADIKTVDDEIVVSENNSPFVSVIAEDIQEMESEENKDVNNPNGQIINKVVFTPPSSPPIVSKGYNFNFDEIDDPFATKTKIRLSPSLETPNKAFEPKASPRSVDKTMPKHEINNRRKPQTERKKPVAPKRKLNSTFSGAVSDKPAEKSDEFTAGDITIDEDKLIQEAKLVHEKTLNVTKEVLKSEQEKDCNNFVQPVITSFSEVVDSDASISILSKELKTNSSSELSTYYSAGTSSSESFPSRNVFNLPEIDDMNFNPFATKSKMRQSPPPSLDMENPFATKSKISNSPESSMICPQNDEKVSEQDIKKPDDKMETELMEKDTSGDLSNTTTSSKATDERNNTIKEINTEDEDTIEGPFLEAEDMNTNDKMLDFDGENIDMMQFNDLPTQANNENLDNGEMFIDAEAFEFLLNQNKSNTVVDSGKESLFLKFDPLFAKRMSAITSDGLVGSLNKLQKKQSTPTKPEMPEKEVKSPVAGPSNLNITQDMDMNVSEEFNDELNVTVSKPMMVVPPAVNPVTPRNKSLTPNRSNRRSYTFTSPAMAVIDRLLSLSGNSSFMHDNTVTQATREQNEADLALSQLRELLAEKEVHVYSLRSESKELKDRLTTLESHLKSLEDESQDRLKKINDLNDRLAEKTMINKSMAAVVEEYERTIASLISETAQDKKKHAEERIKLINERDEQSAHLASMEVSFRDLHSKYEKSKQLILNCKAKEDAYKKSIKDFEENLTKMQNNYELLKQHATSKLIYANQELEKMNKTHEAEVLKLNAMIKRKELHITSLEETLTQKTKANEELTAICDELINKVG